jgi:FixJ family two-component response regulator
MSNEHIAVVDDDASVLKALARLLDAISYRVRIHESGEQFIASLRLQVPECLILDLNMKEMSGEDVQRYLADTRTRIPTIILTARDDPNIEKHCMQAGAVAFLLKPVTPDQLVRAIQTALSTRLLH